jgi:hypothetical protein
LAELQNNAAVKINIITTVSDTDALNRVTVFSGLEIGLGHGTNHLTVSE